MSEIKAKKSDKVKIFIEKGSVRDESMQYIAVNGRSILVPKGKTVEVPAEFAAEYERSRKARADFMQSMEDRAYKNNMGSDPLQ